MKQTINHVHRDTREGRLRDRVSYLSRQEKDCEDLMAAAGLEFGLDTRESLQQALSILATASTILVPKPLTQGSLAAPPEALDAVEVTLDRAEEIISSLVVLLQMIIEEGAAGGSIAVSQPSPDGHSRAVVTFDKHCQAHQERAPRARSRRL